MRKDRELAIKLRKQKKSYNEISKKLGVPKSTMHCWFANKSWSKKIKKELTEKVQPILTKNLLKGGLYSKIRSKEARLKREKITKAALKEIKLLSKENLRLVGSALHWAEGNNIDKYRWALRFANSDPEIIRIMMRFFHEICNIPNDTIKARIHLYPNINQAKATNYWRKITKLPKENFYKPQTQISRASKKKRRKSTLPYGTLHLRAGNTEIAAKVKGWIQGIAKHADVV